MTDSPNLPLPPFGDETDEALSALLDGELGAFAEEHQLTEDAARARLEAWAGAEARLAELDRVRAAVHQPLPALDDVTRRRLVRGASDAVNAPAAPTRSVRPWARIAAIAAAGIIVVGGIGVAVSSIDTGGDKSSSQDSGGGGGSTVASSLTGDVGDLGEVTDASLRALLDGRESTTSQSERAADSGAAAPSAPAAGGSNESSSTTARSFDASKVDPAACAQQLVGTRDVMFSGTGTYEGAPAVIIGVDQGGRTIVFVVSSTECATVLASVSR